MFFGLGITSFEDLVGLSLPSLSCVEGVLTLSLGTPILLGITSFEDLVGLSLPSLSCVEGVLTLSLGTLCC